MKNLTEFSGIILRRGAKVRADKLAALKVEAAAAATEEPSAEANTEAEEVTSAESASTEADAPVDASAEAAPEEAVVEDDTTVPYEVAAAAKAATTPAATTPPDPAPEDFAAVEPAPEAPAGEAPAGEAPAGDAVDASSQESDPETKSEDKRSEPSTPRIDDDVLAAAVAEEMGFSEERTKYLLGALKAVGRKGTDQVRNVRVFQGEEGPKGGFSIGDLHFVIDRIVVPNKGKPGGKDGGKGRGRDGKGSGKPRSSQGRPPGGGRGGAGFDSMARDEKPGDVPSGGLGWSLSRVPGEAKEGRGRGKPGRKGPRRGKPGGKPGDKPGDTRNRNRNRKGGAGRKPPMPEVTIKAPLQTARKPEPAKAPETVEAAKAAPAPGEVTPTETK